MKGFRARLRHRLRQAFHRRRVVWRNGTSASAAAAVDSINLVRVRMLSAALAIVWTLLVLAVDLPGLSLTDPSYQSNLLMTVTHLTGLAGVLAILVAVRFVRSSVLRHILPWLAALFCGLVGTVIALIGQGLHGQITVYVASIIVIAVGCLFRLPRAFLLFFILHAVFVVGMVHVQEDPEILSSHLINGSAFALMAFVLSATLYSGQLRQFHARHTAERQRERSERALAMLRLELDLARSVQQSLLPPPQPGLALLFLPAHEVGGDFCDVSLLADGRKRLFLADATGHGVPAALVTMLVKVVYEGCKREAEGPGAILEALHARFSQAWGHLNLFFTCVAVDISRDGLVWATAGHPPQAAVCDGALVSLVGHGRPIGLPFPDAHFVEGRCGFASRCRVILFSDGLIEETDPVGVEFGEQRVLDVCADTACSEAQEAVDAIRARLLDHRGKSLPNDDVTVVVCDA